jgi:hypothetical protein
VLVPLEEPVELGLEDELLPDGDELELEPDVEGLVDDGGVVAEGGEADGERSAGRLPPTRSLPDSVQAVSSPALSATARAVVSNLFISMLLLVGCATGSEICNARAAAPLDRPRDNDYQCGVIPPRWM